MRWTSKALCLEVVQITSSDHVFERDKNSCIDLGIDIPPQLPYTMKFR
jgi:hypothetical protein